jgi:hypothetical protein
MKKLYLIGALAVGLLLSGSAGAYAGLLSRKPPLPKGLPKKWDKKIPIPPGAVVTAVKPPSGIIQTVDFRVPGEFDGLINFYNSELTKAGFQLGPHVEVPARKAYNLNFSKASVQNTVSIYPDSTDPSQFTVRILYEVPNRHRHLLKLLLERWHVWPRFWRSDKPPAAPAPAGNPAAAATPAAS